MAEAVQTEYPGAREIQQRVGQRSTVSVPLIQRAEPIGVLDDARFEVRPFTRQEIALLETFADQAVIAIENARLFEELEQRNGRASRALWSSRQRTGDVLRVIATSPTDLSTRPRHDRAPRQRTCWAPSTRLSI